MFSSCISPMVACLVKHKTYSFGLMAESCQLIYRYALFSVTHCDTGRSLTHTKIVHVHGLLHDSCVLRNSEPGWKKLEIKSSKTPQLQLIFNHVPKMMGNKSSWFLLAHNCHEIGPDLLLLDWADECTCITASWVCSGEKRCSSDYC